MYYPMCMHEKHMDFRHRGFLISVGLHNGGRCGTNKIKDVDLNHIYNDIPRFTIRLVMQYSDVASKSKNPKQRQFANQWPTEPSPELISSTISTSASLSM
jgi:hypothetical protein